MKFVVTEFDGENHTVVHGPRPWSAGLAKQCGLRGNANPPETPFTIGPALSLRQAVFDSTNQFQEHDEGALDGDVWRYSAVFRTVEILKGVLETHVFSLHSTANELAENNNARGLQSTYETAVAANWLRRKALLDAIDAASSRAELQAVWQDRNNGWTT